MGDGGGVVEVKLGTWHEMESWIISRNGRAAFLARARFSSTSCCVAACLRYLIEETCLFGNYISLNIHLSFPGAGHYTWQQWARMSTTPHG